MKKRSTKTQVINTQVLFNIILALAILLGNRGSAFASTSAREVMYGDDQSMIIQSTNIAEVEAPLLSSPDDITRAKLVVVINKSNRGSTAQTMKVYLDGALIHDWKVSTGREKLETAKSGRVYVTTTPIGYFRPQRVVKLHHSQTWNADMPHSVFFNGGIAIHASNAIATLGSRASGGCVRLAPEHAKIFFDLVNHAGIDTVERIGRSGQTIVDPATKTPSLFRAYNTLIIVENRI